MDFRGNTPQHLLISATCFNAGEWSFPDSPLRGAYARQEVYAHIASWGDFEPWLSRIERCSKAILQSIARDISIEWYGEPHDLDCLLDSLFERRRAVRCPIDDFRKSHRNPFPNWKLGPIAGTSSDRIRALASFVAFVVYEMIQHYRRSAFHRQSDC